MTTKRLLVPMDFSRGSALAIRYAAGLARVMRLPITIVHVVDVPSCFITDYAPDGVTFCTYHHRMVEGAKERLASTIGESPALRGIECDFVVRGGVPAQEIADLAKSGCFEMIVLATHGRTGFARMLIGSVAERIVRIAACPVLAVRASDEETPADARRFLIKDLFADELKLNRILYATDLSATSTAALPQAIAMAERFRCKLDVLTVIDDPATYPAVEWEYLPFLSYDEFFRQSEERAKTSMRASVEKHAADAKWITYVVRRGNPPREIAKLCAKGEYDLVVMGTHGRSGITRAAIGSVTEKVLRSISCPLLTVRATARDERETPHTGELASAALGRQGCEVESGDAKRAGSRSAR
ncbi:MAG: universal stress protein [Planctomycetes bacterium]|nr:universal stress protein [Planctomycetota bacterium]